MNEPINTRFRMIFVELGFKRQLEFSLDTDIDERTISAIMTDKVKASTTVCQALLVRYKSLNARWLLIGEGEMFDKSIITDDNIAILEEPNHPYTKTQYQVTKTEINKCRLSGGKCVYEKVIELEVQNALLQTKLNSVTTKR